MLARVGTRIGAVRLFAYTDSKPVPSKLTTNFPHAQQALLTYAAQLVLPVLADL